MVGGAGTKVVRCVHCLQHQTKKRNFVVCRQGPVGAKIGTSGHMASIKQKIKNSWYASRGR